MSSDNRTIRVTLWSAAFFVAAFALFVMLMGSWDPPVLPLEGLMTLRSADYASSR